MWVEDMSPLNVASEAANPWHRKSDEDDYEPYDHEKAPLVSALVTSEEVAKKYRENSLD